MFCCFCREQLSNQNVRSQPPEITDLNMNSLQQIIIPDVVTNQDDNRNIINIQKIIRKQKVNNQLATIQHNSQILIFNTQESREVVVTFKIKKNILSIASNKQNQQNISNLYEEYLYQFLAKRSKHQFKLIIVEHKNELIEKKYIKYNDPLNIFMVLPYASQHSKIQLKQKNSRLTKFESSNQFDFNDSPKHKYKSIHQQNQIEDQKVHIQSFPFSIVNQIRLSQFDVIAILPPFQHIRQGQTLTAKARIWLSNILQTSFEFIEKQTIILPEGIKLNEIFELIQEIIQQKIRDEYLENIYKIINFELECIQMDQELKYVLLKKRKKETQNVLKQKLIEQNMQKQNQLMLMVLAQNLFMIQIGQKSKFFYNVMLQKLKKIKFNQYVKMKLVLKSNNYSKKTIQKLIKEQKWITEDFLEEFHNQYNSMKKIFQKTDQNHLSKFYLSEQIKSSFNQFLEFKQSNAQSFFYEQGENDKSDDAQSQVSSVISAVIPNLQQEFFEKQVNLESLIISSQQNSIKQYEYQMEQYQSQVKLNNVKSSFAEENQTQLIRKQSRRKLSNQF